MKKTLLIVDDEPSICLILEHYFGDEYHVVVKANGVEAMHRIRV
jgi:CheY-like chemotaxis protein